MFLKRLKIGLSYNPAILLLDIFPKEVKTGVFTPLFIAAFFHSSQEIEAGLPWWRSG